MIRFATALFFALTGAGFAQQNVPIQTGEHDGFSRVVLRIDPTIEWHMETQSGRVNLIFPDANLNFSTDNIFDVMPNSRILGMTSQSSDDQSILTFDLACDCPVSNFDFKNAYIVFDIADGPVLSVSTAEVRTRARDYWAPGALVAVENAGFLGDPYQDILRHSPRQPAALTEKPTIQEEATPPPMAMPDTADDTPEAILSDGGENQQGVVLNGETLSEMASNPVTADDPEMLRRIEEAQTQLLQQLTRAADQGLLDFVEPQKPEEPIEEVQLAPEPDVEMPEIAQIDPELLRQLSARTAYDLPSDQMLTEIVNEFAMPQCLDNGLFSMAGWTDGTSFSAQIGTLRAALIGEFDKPDAEVLTKLVHLYLRYGFATEALQMLSESDGVVENATVLYDIGLILDGRMPLELGPITKGSGCGGAHEMWYLTSSDTTQHILDTNSILDAFANYPIEIRSLIGAQLAAGFINRNQLEQAHIVLETVRRADSHFTSELRLVEALVLENNDNNLAAIKIYEDISNDVDANAPEATINLARHLLEGSGPVSQDVLIDLGAAAFAHKGTDLGVELRLWEIKVMARVEGMSNALGAITYELASENIEPNLLHHLIAEVLAQADPQELGDVVYAKAVLDYAPLLQTTPETDEARIIIAGKMIDLGLPEPAIDLLSPAIGHGDVLANEVAARAYLQLFDGKEAISILGNHQGITATQIRIEAGLLENDSDVVAQILPIAQAQDVDTGDAALRVGNWSDVDSADSDGVLAAYMTQTAQPDSTPAEMAFLAEVEMPERPNLQAARELLEVNKASRVYLENLLEETEVPNP